MPHRTAHIDQQLDQSGPYFVHPSDEPSSAGLPLLLMAATVTPSSKNPRDN